MAAANTNLRPEEQVALLLFGKAQLKHTGAGASNLRSGAGLSDGRPGPTQTATHTPEGAQAPQQADVEGVASRMIKFR